MEFFDVVDENGMPTGSIVERTEAHEKGTPHRTAHIWITRKVENKWQILLQRRSYNKDSFPGRLDTSSAGHIQAGDEPLESAQRELFEELGISAEKDEFVYIGNIRLEYKTEFYGKLFHDNEYVNLFVLNKDIDINSVVIQEEELDSVGWFDLEETVKAKMEHNKDYCVPIETLIFLKDYLYK